MGTPSLSELLREYGELKPYKRVNRYYINIDSSQLKSVIRKLVEAYNGEIYLSSITPVDYIEDGVIEVNYEIQILPINTFIVLKTRIPRNNAVIDSIVDILPGAKILEQEAHDLMGISFNGNPYLRKPFLLPEELAEETPLRKDWKPKTR